MTGPVVPIQRFPARIPVLPAAVSSPTVTSVTEYPPWSSRSRITTDGVILPNSGEHCIMGDGPDCCRQAAHLSSHRQVQPVPAPPERIAALSLDNGSKRLCHCSYRSCTSSVVPAPTEGWINLDISMDGDGLPQAKCDAPPQFKQRGPKAVRVALRPSRFGNQPLRKDQLYLNLHALL